MKRRFTLLGTLLGLASTAQPAKAVDFIRQIQLISGQTIVYDIPIANTTGEIRSKPIEGTGSIFQLYAYEDPIYSPFSLLDATVGTAVHANISLSSHLVDVDLFGLHLDINLGSDSSGNVLPQMLAEKTVGAFIPTATIVIASEDPYFPRRTRADRPYSASVAIDRLPLANATVPDGVPTKVRLEKSYKLYHPTLHIPAENGTGQGVYDQAIEFSLNGTYAMPAIYQNLPGASPTRVMGEETFSAYVRVGPSNSLAKVGSSTIQIWPVSTAQIQNIEAGKRYAAPPQNAQVTLTDLYPDSVTYAQIYKGAPALGKSGYIVPSSVFSINTFAPQNTVVPLQDMINGVTEDGTYTIEVLTVTPFNSRKPERIAYTTIDIKRSIVVNATISTSE